ncbi:metal-binding protein [Gilliamella sp. Choc4-2]|uniref:YecH family metal-binding protein n=1 Tax=unclassified Gilliamella TaxID=2685620 RepID=UPI0004DD1C63|nr:YecH family metal-binding protein [Gilliamella apicola]KFA59629.1 Uncharacterized protein YecH [Gilliamella apicola]OCG33399.1 metal-binding protein [Gilliamella apicola]OCG43551.1 metal-binding protein [Gilliamella apicola]OCG53568.1 metal-binding protein [Gilliamella apicola]OCG63723.1 metal-binding protein [Gilliamella apicola]
MLSIHGHEVLNMMIGNSYTESSLLESIAQKFGNDAKFHTCSQVDMDAKQLIAFLKSKGKFKPVNDLKFTINLQKICRH